MPISHSTGTAITYTSLNSLANDNWAFSAQVDISTADAHDVIIGGYFTTDADWPLDDSIELYIAAASKNASDSLTASIAGGIASGLAGSDAVETEGTDFMKESLHYVRRVLTRASNQENYHIEPFSLLSELGFIPAAFQLVSHPVCVGSETLHTTGGSFWYNLMKLPTS